MKKNQTKANAPITFEIDQLSLSNLKKLSRKVNAKSLSNVIRHAIRSFKFHNYNNTAVVSKQISVRLPIDLKNLLNEFSTKKRVSVGELLRVAIQDLCSQSPKHQTIKAMIMATSTPKKAAARRPAAKKSSAKKKTTKKSTAKRPAAKRPAARKAVAKKRPAAKKSSSAKKKTAKKSTAKRPAARKTVARKKTTAKKK